MWSGERLEANIVGRIAIEHLHRYALSLNYVKNKIALANSNCPGSGCRLWNIFH